MRGQRFGRYQGALAIPHHEAWLLKRTIQTELQALKSSHHEHVVSYYSSFVEDESLWIVMDLMNQGELASDSLN